MTQPDRPPQKSQPAQLMQGASLLAVGGEIGCLTLLIVIVAVFGGIYLDKILNTKPVLTILFVLGSAPVSLALTYWVAMRAVKRITPQNPNTSVQPGKIYDEEDNSE